jgi:GMP synthase-like glutamine amidotransferase
MLILHISLAIVAMAKKHILYIQFNTGEVGRLEQSSLRRTAGDIAQFSFISAQLIGKVKIDLMHDCDQVIIGPAPLDFPEGLELNIAQFVDQLITTNYPTLGIGFGHLVLAEKFGFQIMRSQEYAEIDSVVEYQVRNPQAEISPTFGIDLAEDKTDLVFHAYTNHYDSIVDGDRSQILITSSKSPYAAIAYSQKIFGVEFIPFVDQQVFPWWIRPYPDFWRNLKGFWQFKRARNNRVLNRAIDWFTHKYLLTKEESDSEHSYQQHLKTQMQDFDKAISVLRNFITKINKV